eukprot:Hpha_TRINITY_DN5273_c0_g1::TRINITY_DN5273_c0_g1_i1::g.116629::m.116629/K03943/NDUFV2; NADH dehydrogenase (ubiquinone) flavoprotein 2
MNLARAGMRGGLMRRVVGQQVRYSVPWANHINTPLDNERIPWDFTAENHKRIDQIMAGFPDTHRESGINPLLHLAMWQNGGWIPVTAMQKIAQICEVPVMRVYETVTFYTMFNRRPVGKYHVQFCVTTCCMIVGSDELIQVGLKHLGLERFGQIDEHGISLAEMECMGCCVNAPMVCVADYSNPPHFAYDYYEDLTPETLINVLEHLKKGERHKLELGSQCGRQYSAPLGGKTSLIGTPPGPYCRDLTEEKAAKA